MPRLKSGGVMPRLKSGGAGWARAMTLAAKTSRLMAFMLCEILVLKFFKGSCKWYRSWLFFRQIRPYLYLHLDKLKLTLQRRPTKVVC